MKTILIVEDDVLLIKMYSQLLQSPDRTILEASDGKIGLEIVTNNKPDLILLDVMLGGGLNGFDVLENLKKSDLTKNIPVIMHTSLDSEAKTAGSIGADAYFIKSKTKLEELADKVDELIK